MAGGQEEQPLQDTKTEEDVKEEDDVEMQDVDQLSQEGDGTAGDDNDIEFDDGGEMDGLLDEEKEEDTTPDKARPHMTSTGGLTQQAPWYYESRGHFATLLQWTMTDLDRFIVQNKRLHEYATALEGVAPSTTDKKTTRGTGLVTLRSKFTASPSKYKDPTKEEQAGYTSDDWTIHLAALCQKELKRHAAFKAFQPPIISENRWTWGYLLLQVVVKLRKMKKGTWLTFLQDGIDKADQQLEHAKAEQARVGRAAASHPLATPIPPMEPEEKAISNPPIVHSAEFTGERNGKSPKRTEDATVDPPTQGPGNAPIDTRYHDTTGKLLSLIDHENRLKELEGKEAKPLSRLSRDDVLAALERGRKELELKNFDKEAQQLDPQPGSQTNAHVLRDQLKLLEQPKHAYRRRLYTILLGALRNYTGEFFREFKHVDVSQYRERIQKPLSDFGKAVGDQVFDISKFVDLVQATQIRVKKDTQSLHRNAKLEAKIDLANSVQQGEQAQTPRRSARAAEASKGSISLDESYLKNLELNDDTDYHDQAAKIMANLIDGPEFQFSDLAASMAFLLIEDENLMRMPHQCKQILLHWWQVLFPKWSDTVLANGKTIGGILADYVGLGKTMSYSAKMHESSITASKAFEAGTLTSCRPWLVITLPSMVGETATQIARFAPGYLKVTVVHASPGLKTGGDITVTPRLSPKDDLFNTTDPSNLRACIVTSFDTFAAQWGPAAMIAWAKSSKRKLSDDSKIPPLDTTWPGRPTGKFRGLILDEPQVGLRNDNTHRTAVEYIQPDEIWLFSGSPAPRGLKDYGSYLGLISIPAVENEAKAHMAQPARTIDVGGREFVTKSNVYKLEEDHPARKFCFTRAYFDLHITQPMIASRKSEERQVALAKLCQPVLAEWILRRDYNSACPPGSKNVIAKGMPPIFHVSKEGMFSLSAQEEYNAGYDKWKNRLVSGGDQANDTSVKPNPRTLRSISLQTFWPPLRHLHAENPEYEKPQRDPTKPGYKPYDPKERPTIKNQRDWFSWFWDGSEIWKRMPATGTNFRRIRWLIREIVLSQSYEELTTKLFPTTVDVGKGASAKKQKIKPDDWLDTDKVSNGTVLSAFLRYSPKLQACFTILLKHFVIRNEKIIFWFRWPIVQELFNEVICSTLPNGDMKSLVFTSIDAQKTTTERAKIRDSLNDLDNPLKIVSASMEVVGTGTNYQYGCWVGVLVESCDTLDKEVQVIGRTHRLGAKQANWIYSLLVAETADQRSLTSVLQTALSSKAAMVSFTKSAKDDEDAASPAMDGLFEFADSDNPMAGWFEYRQEGKKVLLHIHSPEGQAAMEDLVATGAVKRSRILDQLLPPPEALGRLMRAARAQVVIQHGGSGNVATTNLSWLRLQEEEERRKYSINVALLAQMSGKKRRVPGIVRKEARVPDENGDWKPTAETYWNEWDGGQRAWYQDKMSSGFFGPWTVPPKTKEQLERQKAKRMATRQAREEQKKTRKEQGLPSDDSDDLRRKAKNKERSAKRAAKAEANGETPSKRRKVEPKPKSKEFVTTSDDESDLSSVPPTDEEVV